MEVFENLSNSLTEFLNNAGILAPIFSTVLVYLEGIFAFLPLFVFVTINVITMGPILGFIISWIFTILGCFTTFYLSRKGLSKIFSNFINDKKQLKKIYQFVNKIKFNQLVLIIAIPFAPSFFINVASGISKIPPKKFFYALIIGKIFSIAYLCYIGVNIYECLENPIVIVKIFVLLIIAYLLGKYLSKKFNMDERF